MTPKKDNSDRIKPEGVMVRLVWGSSINVPTTYANNLFITHTANEFYLVFGELSPVTELDIEQVPEYLEIKPVAKIAVTPENMVKFADVIAENMVKFKEKVEKMKE